MRCRIAAQALWFALSVAVYATQADDMFWQETTDERVLKVEVIQEGGKCFLNNISGYAPDDINVYYFVDWDLIGTQREGLPLSNIEVEPNRLYLVHMYQFTKPNTLFDFCTTNDPNKMCAVAFVWVDGQGVRKTVRKTAKTTGVLTEIRESPDWFRLEKGKHLPSIVDLLPPFKTPSNKVFCLGAYSSKLTLSNLFSRGVTHVPGGGGEKDTLPLNRRLDTLPTGFLNDGIGTQPSDDSHISPKEKAFLLSPYSYVSNRAASATYAEFMFLDEEHWHGVYQPETIERLCLFYQEIQRINPDCKPSDFWSGAPPYRWFGGEGVSASQALLEAASHYDAPDKAMLRANPTTVRKVTVNGKETSLAESAGSVCMMAYFDHLFGYNDSYDQFWFDQTFPTWIHFSRVNKRLPCNQGKPVIWFGMSILEGWYSHPLIPYRTRTTNPPGTITWSERLPVAPSVAEELAFFGLLEGDGAYLWDSGFGVGDDPQDMFGQIKYATEYHDSRGRWDPDVPGTPIGNSSGMGAPYLTVNPLYYGMAAWKFSKIADVVQGGRKVDFDYSLDEGKTWYTPPTNGSAMVDVIAQHRPIVTGAVKGRNIAVVAFHPYQGISDTTSILIRHGKNRFQIDLFGKRLRVYRGKLR